MWLVATRLDSTEQNISIFAESSLHSGVLDFEWMVTIRHWHFGYQMLGLMLYRWMKTGHGLSERSLEQSNFSGFLSIDIPWSSSPVVLFSFLILTFPSVHSHFPSADSIYPALLEKQFYF